MERFDEILRYWFKDLTPGDAVPQEHINLWFNKDEAVDKYVKEQFEADYVAAREGQLKSWESDPNGYLALIFLMDLFPRMAYRDTLEAYALDKQAIRLCLRGLERGFDQALPVVHRVFFYMPMEHSEDIQIQQKCVNYFTLLAKQASQDEEEFIDGALDFAIRRAEVIERFGRFPHRNSILGRESSKEEVEFLNEPGISY